MKAVGRTLFMRMIAYHAAVAAHIYRDIASVLCKQFHDLFCQLTGLLGHAYADHDIRKA